MRPPPVVTPEAVPLDLELAGVGSRFAALLIDLLILGALVFGLIIGAALSGAIESLTAVAVFAALMLALVWAYPVAWESLWRGRSPGKAALGLRVVTADGAPVGFRHAALRSTLGLVDFWLSSGAVAVIAAFASTRNQRLGDMVAGTVVLRERSGAKAPVPASFDPPPELSGFTATIDTTPLTPDDYAAVRAWLLRAPTLPAHVANELAVQLADALAARLRPAAPAGCSAPAYLAAVAAAYQRRHRGPEAPEAPEAPDAPPPDPPPPAPPPAPPAPPPDPPPRGFAPMG